MNKKSIFLACLMTISSSTKAASLSSWIGEWWFYNPETQDIFDFSKFIVTDFDGEQIFSSNGMTFRTNNGFGIELTPSNSSCSELSTSKDKMKIMVNYKKCSSNISDAVLICELKNKNNPLDEMIECTALGQKKYFKRKR